MIKTLVDIGGGVKKWIEGNIVEIRNDVAEIPWRLEVEPLMKVTSTNTIGATRKLMNPSNGFTGREYEFIYTLNATGGHNLTFDTNYVLCEGFICVRASSTTLVKVFYTGTTYFVYMYPQFLSGTTAQRPVTSAVGAEYFDTTLGKPIWHNGTNWVDSLGVIA